MKHHLLIICSVLTLSSFWSFAQTTVTPDENFEAYLETHNSDGEEVDLGDPNSMGDGIANNGLVETNRINNVTLLDVSNRGIEDLTGIEDFTALETLFCSENNLSVLNVSNNTNLESLICGSNNLTELVLSANTNLESLNCSNNQIQTLELGNNNALESLTVSGNQLSAIDVSDMPGLVTLGVSNNRIFGQLDVSNNPNLEGLFCASNQISVLDLSQNTVLRNLDVSNNALTDLDLSSINTVVCPDPQTNPITPCQGSSSINVSRNQLVSLVINNAFNDLIAQLNSSDNPDLFCIQIDTDFTPSGWIKDDWTYYSSDACVDIFTYVPDDNFEQALIDLGLDDVLDNLVLTANINTVPNLTVSNASISSLVGIEDFTALENLDVGTNSIDSLDLSANTALQELDISNNDIETLDLSTNTALTTLYCGSNLLNTIDLSANLALTVVNCSNNLLTGLDVSNNTVLFDLDTSFNQITFLDLSLNTALASLLCNDNNLFALNINNGNNNTITTFNATNNANLFCIEVEDVTLANAAAGWQKDTLADYNLTCGTYVPDDNFEQALIDQGIDSDNTLNNFVPTADVSGVTDLEIASLGIEDLTGIGDFVALLDLDCSGNAISVLDLSANTALQTLNCSDNSIINLDLATNGGLTSILCNGNALATLNIANGFNTNLTVFNATNNPTLFCINIDTAILGNIPPAWQIDVFADYNDDCANNRFTAIPDPFFEQALIDLAYDDVIDGQVLTATIEQVQNLNVSDQGISDLSGIQDFRTIVELDCSSNFLTALDVSGLSFLERLNCSSNFLETNDINNPGGLFNITGTISLRELFCASNNLTDLDTSQNINLELLDCADNNLTVLNVNSNTLLKNLNCSNNALSSLDISSNAALEVLNADSNELNALLTASIPNTSLITLSCADNDLTELLVNNYQGLNSLNCGSNALTELNLTANTGLNFLSITNNQISNLNLLNNIDLVEALLSQNNLVQLDVSANTSLEHLNCAFNDLTELNIDLNTLLKRLYGASNQLTALDLSNNSSLIDFDFSSNAINNLSLSNDLGALKRLNVSNNQIEGDLDLTTMAISACVAQPTQTNFCPDSISINVSNNLLDFVNIQNGINGDIANLNAVNNPNLECIQVDDANTIGANWQKDETTSYNEDCNFGETFVPDDNFEQKLIDFGFDDAPLNDFVPTANIEGLTNLDLSDSAIADLTGIEDFVALEILNISNNVLSEVDLSSNVNLVSLDCSANLLSQLNIQNNTNLSDVNCANNTIAVIDVDANINLVNLNISDNVFTAFLPSTVLSLQVLNADNNQIVELNFQQNQNLISLSCQSNALEILNIRNGQNAILMDLNAQDNPELTCIETDNGNVPLGATWLIDPMAQFSTECFFGQTFVPDDNFEQALIDFGYDSGALDDYVFTENIQDLTFLNVSGREISDLTGIEDFMSLTTLDFENNSLATVNLASNTLLINLDASGNLLTVIDLSFLPNLTDLDVSNNNLTQLNLDSNLGLIDLDVANNMLIDLSVDQQIDLEELNCASNQLSSLNVTQNPNLTLLFCQSNQLVADQLNLQNGNNENLQLFNATNNQDLACILVDDPVAVINNTEGLYDSWFKDETASYQSVCADADNDGIPNEDDLCPNTEFGATVDLFGCAVIDLPIDNFAISVTSETCLNSNNGIITIIAQELYNYNVSLVRDDFSQDYNFTNDIDIFNLLAGTYEMCITIEEWPDYQSCYTIVITQPDPLEVFSNRMASGNILSVIMMGNSKYNIEFNGDLFTTYNPSINLELQQGVNSLKVYTDLDCQGIYEERIVVSDEPIVTPNPFNNRLSIYTNSDSEVIIVHIYNIFGQRVLSQTFNQHTNDIQIDTSRLAAGMYLMAVQTDNETTTHKIIKE
jgi:Leucine-rich repeat (LRR) protein